MRFTATANDLVSYIISLCKFSTKIHGDACSPPHHVRFTDLWTRSGTDHYNYGLGALYPLP